MALQIVYSPRSERPLDEGRTYLVARAEIVRRPEEITLNETFEKVKEEAIGAVIDAGDGALKDRFKRGDDQAKT